MRIKDLPQAESILDSVFFAVDSNADGTKKVTKGHLLGTLPSDVSGLLSDVAGIQSDISTIEGNITGIDGDITDIQSDVQTLSAYEPLRLDIASFDTLPKTVSNAAITSDMVVLESWLSNPSAQAGDWTVTTSNGSLVVSGTIAASKSTALTLILGKANV